MVATKPQISRDYVYVPFTEMNMDVADLVVNQIAFLNTPGIAPTEPDWLPAIVVTTADVGIYVPSIGEGLTALIGPDRGDVVTTEDLPEDDYQVWVDASVAGSDERIVRLAGMLTINATGA